jgi:hypothetical protein
LNRRLECIRLRFRRVTAKYERSAAKARGRGVLPPGFQQLGCNVLSSIIRMV